MGKRWSKVGLSIGVGGPPGVGNVATYRRTDFRFGASVPDQVASALAEAEEPPELVATPRMALVLAPFAPLFSDSLLVSNLGQVDVPNAGRIEFYPVAHGRSAVSFGVAVLSGGAATIALRAGNLSRADADQLLDDVVTRVAAR